MERKFTDDEIVKALECCMYGRCDDNCPFFKKAVEKCNDLDSLILDLINRQKAEIESLKEAYAIYEETTGLKWARAETIKEFAERLKQYCALGGDFGDPCGVLTVTDRWIDHLVKEMTGEDSNE